MCFITSLGTLLSSCLDGGKAGFRGRASVVDVNVHCHLDKARVGTGGGGGLETQSGLSAIWNTVSAESSALEWLWRTEF